MYPDIVQQSCQFLHAQFLNPPEPRAISRLPVQHLMDSSRQRPCNKSPPSIAINIRVRHISITNNARLAERQAGRKTLHLLE